MWGADDPCDRMPMVWAELSYEPQQSDPLSRKRRADPVAFDDDLFRFYQAAIKFRRDNPALHGDTSLRFFIVDNEQLICYGKSSADLDDVIIHPVHSMHGMVSSESALASDVGVEVLRKGGNAVDAAVATGFALAVTMPNSGNMSRITLGLTSSSRASSLMRILLIS